MERLRVSEMWADLKDCRDSRKSNLLSDCEPELQELMKRIDAMVHSKLSGWEKEKQSLQARLEVRQQEYDIQKATLQHKHEEIGQLRAQVEVLEIKLKDASSQYEMQLSSVRAEVDNMKKEYKRYRQRERSKSKSSDKSDAKIFNENRKLVSQLEEYKRKNQDWEQDKRMLQHQIESMQSQNKTLEEKLSLSEHQTSSYQSQLDKRREMLDSTELNLKSQVTQLETQLQRARDMVNSQDTQLSRLRASYEEALASQRRALEEKEVVEAELHKSQQNLMRSQEEVHGAKLGASAQDEVLRQSQADIKRLNLQLSRLKDQLSEQNGLVSSLELDVEHTEEISALQDDLNRSKSQVKSLKKSEQNLKQEVLQLKDQLDHLKRECSQLNKQLSNKIAEMKRSEKAELVRMKKDLSQVQTELLETKGKHQGDVESMKYEVQCASKEVQQKALALSSANEKVVHLEKNLKHRTETLDRREAELKVNEAQLDALRMENRQLRQAAYNFSSTRSNKSLNETLDLADTEAHMKELRSAYDASIGTLEAQNSSLSLELTQLRKQLHDADAQSRMQTTLKQAKLSMSPSRSKENSLRMTSSSSNQSNSYEDQIEHLQSKVHQLEKQLDSRNTSISILGLEHEVLSEFVGGVENVVQSPNLFRQTDDNEPEDSAEIAIANLVADQDRRTADLQHRLNCHINDLKLATESVFS